ncbi:Zinc/iron permease [Lipomyces japonicus]|uniref:Zinc/iron permease n=1 Tax=Lipomyces japonicus TaxID=56871 RepID=UPI0034CF65EE
MNECSAESLDGYNVQARVASIFIVFAASASAVFLPLLIHRAVRRTDAGVKSSRADLVLTIIKQFGAGVIIATAFIHLLPDAFESFANPCIGDVGYDAWPGAIALVGVLLTFVIENIGHRIVAERIKRAHNKFSEAEEAQPLIEPTNSHETITPHKHTVPAHHHQHGHADEPEHSFLDHGQYHLHTHGHTFYELDDDLTSTDERKQIAESIDRLSLYVLEAGIIFHSVLIGITLAVATPSAFASLLVVIILHQFFEGMALGTRIIAVRSISRSRRIGLCVWFCSVTPIGIAIGILARRNYAGDSSPLALWVMGTMNALSAGILLWVSLVELLAEEWMHGDLHEASIGKSLAGFLAVVVGALLMSVLGEWI